MIDENATKIIPIILMIMIMMIIMTLTTLIIIIIMTRFTQSRTALCAASLRCHWAAKCRLPLMMILMVMHGDDVVEKKKL